MRAATVALLLLTLGGTAQAGSADDLLRAYPDFLAGVDGADLIWRDGTRMQLGEALPDRSLREQLRHGSILDQIRMTYPVGAAADSGPLDDPGRIRNRAFFDKMYGNCHAGEVTPRLGRVVWLPHHWGHTVSITTVNGVDRRLQAISRELDELPVADFGFLHPLGGTYVCRAVADTGEPSVHGWGAAIDINPKRTRYWLWRQGASGPADGLPAEIVAVFEKHGFIWGGRWAHYDTMHFEYRPELLGYDPSSQD